MITVCEQETNKVRIGTDRKLSGSLITPTKYHFSTISVLLLCILSFVLQWNLEISLKATKEKKKKNGGVTGTPVGERKWKLLLHS